MANLLARGSAVIKARLRAWLGVDGLGSDVSEHLDGFADRVEKLERDYAEMAHQLNASMPTLIEMANVITTAQKAKGSVTSRPPVDPFMIGPRITGVRE